jgi:hypothetical protein
MVWVELLVKLVSISAALGLISAVAGAIRAWLKRRENVYPSVSITVPDEDGGSELVRLRLPEGHADMTVEEAVKLLLDEQRHAKAKEQGGETKIAGAT